MKLTKAIEILELNVMEAGNKMPLDTFNALKLGIEALKRLKVCSKRSCVINDSPLLGETEE